MRAARNMRDAFVDLAYLDAHNRGQENTSGLTWITASTFPSEPVYGQRCALLDTDFGKQVAPTPQRQIACTAQ